MTKSNDELKAMPEEIWAAWSDEDILKYYPQTSHAPPDAVKYTRATATPTDGEAERALEALEWLEEHCWVDEPAEEVARSRFKRIRTALQSTRKPPVLKIGEYTLTDDPQHGLMIYHESGEGGQFKVDALSEVVDKFYKENF